MLVLGLDPGLADTGYGLVVGDGRDLRAVSYGVIRTPANTPVGERLAKIYQEMSHLLGEYHPDVAAVEELFFCRNVRTAMMVGEARGVLLLALAEAGLEVAEYTPLQIKEGITGYGRAEKGQVQEMVRVLLCLKEVPRPDDAADALAVAICHQHAARMSALVRESDTTEARR
ncbi:MAG: crossover junction endodeoxyribonuclease RuvC [Chloroflexota bacterium]|nr:crossover junction endodeoxyribonuclease RuvC [Chloroflexota bacterium]